MSKKFWVSVWSVARNNPRIDALKARIAELETTNRDIRQGYQVEIVRLTGQLTAAKEARDIAKARQAQAERHAQELEVAQRRMALRIADLEVALRKYKATEATWIEQ